MDYSNFPQKVREQFAVYGVLGTGTFGEVRLAYEKVSLKNHFNVLNLTNCIPRYLKVLVSNNIMF